MINIRIGQSRIPEDIIPIPRLLAAGVLTVALATPASAATTASAATPGWMVDLQRHGPVDVNTTASAGALTLADPHATALASRTAIGALITEPHRLTAPTSSLRATVDAQVPAGGSVAVAVRGQRADGGWTEWIPAGESLPVPVQVVQARVTLTAGTGGTSPRVHGVRLQPGAAGVVPQATRAASSFRVFATREGLIGGTTANGHVIVPQDHFVALPSERGLAPKATGDYTVRICAANGRCEWAPVWDEGPWNVHDDYWNPGTAREEWQHISQGEPEAQAAYSDGFNGGKDGFGRKVTNPAGIDLADGTFWDGLKLTDDAWVTVTYLWTAPAGRTGVVNTELNVRTGPHGDATAVGLADEDAQVPIVCQVHGDTADGSVKKTDLWDELATGYYVSDAYVDTGSTGQVAPDC